MQLKSNKSPSLSPDRPNHQQTKSIVIGEEVLEKNDDIMAVLENSIQTPITEKAIY